MSNQHINPSNNRHKNARKDGRKVAIILISFFAIFASVDTYFVFKAVTTNTGTVVPKPYEIGLNYNQILKEAQEIETQDTKDQSQQPHEQTANPK